ncbi:unnamed protein product [Peronospora farinosa]|uniref:Uncharacterized protein n=1 Tax=Peronospora farinosa TaxID=134698 RepID=A0AAV0U9S4_9STRA|nr:unnamed protein product [Peronospora farinosa]CAI5733670.1 unnamed protein product [Peronospora farinosa]
MLGTGFKMAVMAAAMACYVHPQLLLQPFIGSELDASDANALVRVLRGLLTLLSYGLASFRPSWFYVLVTVAALQLTLWSLQLADNSILGVSVEKEEKLFLMGAVACFGAIMSILLFGGKGDDRARFRKRLVAFYAKHNPEKLQQVNELVEKYELNEELLFQRLHRKYNALAAGADSHSVMKKIDENEFLYEEEEEERVESDEDIMAIPNEAVVYPLEKEIQQRFSSSGSDEDFEVVDRKNGAVVRQLEAEDYDRLDGTPPASPRTAEKLAHKHRQSSTLIKKAIAVARQDQQKRIERRIANIASKSRDGYAGH